MKKIIICLITLTVLCGCVNQNIGNNISPEQTENTSVAEAKENEVRSVWIAYYELGDMIESSSSRAEFEKKLDTAFKKIKDFGFNTVTVQIRACADAFYNSAYFPKSEYCKFSNNKKIDFDVLGLLTKTAHQYGLKFEAWINPYRVSQNNNIKKVPKSSIAYKWYSSNKKDNLIITDSKIYFNPAKKEVTRLIINGVKEICENYNVDSIHFDDYFYPDTNKNMDEKDYKNYQSNGGELSLKLWRQNNINQMIKSVYKAIKDINKDIVFGISPQGNIDNNENCLYADVEEWIRNDGYVDYICPQIYYGFKNETLPFMFTVKKWCGLSKCKLYIGLPLYKSGKADEYASANDKESINEFKNYHNIISRQINYVRGIDDVDGYYIFSYSYIFENNDKAVKEEVSNMKKLFWYAVVNRIVIGNCNF